MRKFHFWEEAVHISSVNVGFWQSTATHGFYVCVFPLAAMQEEALKLVLLALEDGSALSRKVLVLFVVQRLEPRFPQASKTSIGHVVQLLYRASCFKVCHWMKNRRNFHSLQFLKCVTSSVCYVMLPHKNLCCLSCGWPCRDTWVFIIIVIV